jgi:hypothetical protein
MNADVGHLSEEFSRFQKGTSTTSYRYPAALRSAALRAFRQNPNISISEFAKQIGVSGSAFFKWVTADKEQSRSRRPSDFIEVESTLDVRSQDGLLQNVRGHGILMFCIPMNQTDLIGLIIKQLKEVA